MSKLAKRVRPGEPCRLSAIDPGQTTGCKGKKAARKALQANRGRLQELQETLYADGSKALLIVLQAPDTAGKDGTIAHVMGAFNPQGVQVTSFKQPTPEELAHDFLWRVHRAAPRLGMVGIFNRSHYEDVLVVRVRKLVPKAVWSARYEQINAFEQLLVSAGVTIVKVFLHLSPEEQARRLQARQQTRQKQWKFNPGDLEERKLWRKYQAAYEYALTRCSTEAAPWWVVPADHKWYARLAVSEILLETMQGMGLHFPEPVAGIDSYKIPEV